MDVKKEKGRVGNVDRKIIWAQQTPPGYLKPKNRFSQQMLQEFSTITLHLPLLHNDSLLFLCWNTVLIKELKIAVDGPEDTFENKLDEMGSVIFDYRGEKKKDFEVYEKEMRQFEDERSDSRGTCLPNYKWEKGLMEGAFRKWRC